MENGVDRVVDETQLENNNNVKNEVSKDKVEDKKEVLGDKVEALEGKNEVFRDKAVEKVTVGSSESKDLKDEIFEEALESPEQLQEEVVKFESDGVVGSVGGSGLMVGDTNSDVGNGTEKFESHELDGGDSGSVVVYKKQNVGNEMEKFEEPIFVPAESGNSKELIKMVGEEKVVDLVGTERVHKIDEGGTAVEVEGIVLNGGDVVSEIASDGGTEVLKGEDGVDSMQEIESSEGILPEDSKREEIKVDGLSSEYQVTREPTDASAELQERRGELLDENPTEVDTEGQDDNSGELKGDGVHKGEHPEAISATANTKHLDTSNGDSEDTLALVDPGHHEKTPELKATSAFPHTAHILQSSLDNSVNEKNEEIQADAANLRAENNKDSEPEHAAENVNGVGQSNIVSEEPERIGETHQEKQNTPVNKEGERDPEPKLASLSGKSSNPAPFHSRPAGLGLAAPSWNLQLGQCSSCVLMEPDPTNAESEEHDETREKLKMIRVKFLRLVHRLGLTPSDTVVAQVLYRLGAAEQLRGRNQGRIGTLSFDPASAMAEQLEADGQEPLDFSCTIMVLGKTGVGKSATINSIFDEAKFPTNAFQSGTKVVQDVVGTVQGIKVRVIDTPGLLPSWSDQRQNEKILHSVKNFIKKTPPDIVLYLDRLDMQSKDFGDLLLLRTISKIFGPSIWLNAIVVLSHAASAPPDSPQGTASSYDMFVTQRSHVVQQAIRQAAGDMWLVNPVSLVENHSACRRNRAGLRVLPNGQFWKPQLLLLSFASKILAEANTILKLQDSPPKKHFATRSRAPPLPYLLSSLLRSRPQVKLPEEQFGDEDGLDDDMDESSDSEDESEYDDLPPFKSLTKAQVAKLTKAQKKAYFDELDYREKLFMKKQLKEEKRQRRMMKKTAAAGNALPSDYSENAEEESEGPASVPVPMPDLALPASFDSDNPTHRYRYLDNSNQWLVRPVLDTHGWDHDVGYEGINVERLFVVKHKIPISFSGQVTKDKKDGNVQMELASSIKHGEGKATSLGFDMQTLGKDLGYTLRSETRFINFRKNKATAGLSVTLLGDALSAGVKVEDKLIANKRFQMVMSGGAMTGRGDIAYGGSLEAQLRDEDYPLGRSLSTLGLSVVDWHGVLAVGCNIQSQVPIGRSTNLIARANLNNKGAGQLSVRINSSEYLQIALAGLLPLEMLEMLTCKEPKRYHLWTSGSPKKPKLAKLEQNGINHAGCSRSSIKSPRSTARKRSRISSRDPPHVGILKQKMENGFKRVVVEEKINVGNEGFGDKVEEERLVVGSDESKDLEDEVFEEAIESHEQLQEEEEVGMKVESDGVVVESVGDLSSVVVDESTNLGNEAEKFEEAIFVPAESGNPEELSGVVVEEKVKDLVGEDIVYKIDEGGTAKESGSNESSAGEVAEIVGNGVAEVLKAEGDDEMYSKQGSELGEEILPKDNEREELKENKLVTEYQVTSDNSVSILEDKGEGMGQNLLKMDAEHLDEKTGALKGDGETAKEVGNNELIGGVEISVKGETQALTSEGGANSDQEIESSKELNGDGESAQEAVNSETSGGAEVSEIAGNLGREALKAEDEADPNREIESIKEIRPEDSKSGELQEDKLGAEYQEANKSFNVSGDLQGDKSEGLDENPEKKDIKHKVEKNEDFDSAIVGLDSGNGVDKSEQFTDIAAGVDVEDQGDGNRNSKDVSAVIASEQNGETHELKAASAVPQTVVDEIELVPEVLASSSLEKSVIERNEEIQAHASNSRAEDNKFSAVHHAANNSNGISENTTVTEEPQKKAEKGQEDKQTAPANIERKILHLPEIAPSSAKSSSAAPTPSRPAGLGRAAPLLEPAPRAVQQPRAANGAVSHTQSQHIEDPTTGESEEFDETREKLQMIRVKFLRLAHRLGQTPHNVVVAQVLYRLGLAEQLRGRNGGRVAGYSFDRASAMAEQLEAAGQEPLDFSCTIMVLGKSGVGKSATINSIFDEVKFGTDAFQLGTKKVQDVVGTVQGIKVRVIDTPGLLPSWSDQRQNEKILHSVKRFIKKTPPDIVLYLDRLDMQSRDFGDMPLLRTITDIFGPSIWFNAIVVLTHAASAPPDGPNGTASSYDMFVTQRSHAVQQAIRQAAGDMRLMNPVSLVENHSACRTNRAGQRVLPNGQVWKPHLLLLSFASKILAEANALLKLQDSAPARPFATRSRAPPLPFLLSSLLQSRPQVKLPEEQYGDEDGLDDDLDESSDSEDESEYDELPSFKSLTKAQIAKLTKAQKKAYFDELEYREKLFVKKQLKEEKRRRKMMKKMAAAAKDLPSEYTENAEEEVGGAASVPVPMPDLALPASFDSDNPTHRYRYLDSSNQWLVRPVLETHGWDHDVGYEGINVERLFVVKDKIPISFSGQVSKDKKDANVQMELASSVKHGEGKATSLGFDMQTVGKDLAYTLRSETRFSNFRKNKATAGLSVTLLGDVLSAGVKVEDKLIAGKRFQMVMSGGAMTGRGDAAYGGSLEVQLRDKDYPLGRSLSTLGLSVMDWHGDLAIGCNVQSQIPIGRSTNLIGRANLNNRGAGQISIRLNSSEQLQLALKAWEFLMLFSACAINKRTERPGELNLPSFRLLSAEKKQRENKAESVLFHQVTAWVMNGPAILLLVTLLMKRRARKRFYGVVVSTLDFESSDLGSTPGNQHMANQNEKKHDYTFMKQ
ncbi:unnamed protein product [Dovyalis caffra]|uniref:AIG1-type G domain-containing protein n=1 Tax=Dovyalis caffra TaxID=77055 RepID=A0AAV1RB14_9ROSI|nr:unnamed protein product [Dovyalis caffra]